MEDGLTVTEETFKEAAQEQKELFYNQVEELKRSNAALRAENDMFERFIGRIVAPAGGGGLGAAGAFEQEAVGHETMWISRSNISNLLHQLTLEQKLFVAQKEVTETKQDQEKLKQTYEQIQDNYKISMKVAEIRLAEIKKAKSEFERRLLKPISYGGLKMKESEKVLQFIGDKSKFTHLEKLNMKNQELKAHEKKLQQQLLQKKETGKAEYEEFFQEHSEQRVEKNLDELQVNNLKIQRVLSSHKEKLETVTLESAQLSHDINNRKLMLEKMEKEIQYAEMERLKAEALNQHLRRQMRDYQAPNITDYMHIKDKHKKLQQRIHTWERKIAVAQMVWKMHDKAGKQQITVTPAYSAEAGVRPARHPVPVKLPYIREHST
ncbi:cilia- and flagella-associated protein 263-like isoform X2 [Antennarius striatus]|uniref:cilia- and flagella-associated protein 263-like isoform X2 n=1 Tax=Antennarius striatus TaxID=241820 RepID=UPI0035B0F526